MPAARRLACWLTVLALLAALPSARFFAAEDPAGVQPSAVKPSEYAPIDDLVSQVESFVESIESDLADPAAYGEYQQGRVAKDANTVAALALVLGKHDKHHKLKGAAPAIIRAARQLGDEAGNFERAQRALKQLQQALAAPASPAADPPALDWKPVANIQQLMQQVPVVNNSLRRGVTGRRFERSIDKSAGQAATLAAIAQASIYNTDYCEDAAAEKEWARICAEMREAAAAVNRAVRKADQEAARQGLARLVETCDACHEQFR